LDGFVLFLKLKLTVTRTDKGAHSQSNLVSCKIELSLKELEDFKKDVDGLEISKKLNNCLPEDIRIFSVQLTKSK
jgi:tRNA U38,U39,U40 pseudouridine synthase TruA